MSAHTKPRTQSIDNTLDPMLDQATEQAPVQLGRYLVQGPLSAGGMGKVYAAVHQDHRSRVALKTLLDVDADRISVVTRDLGGRQRSASRVYANVASQLLQLLVKMPTRHLALFVQNKNLKI